MRSTFFVGVYPGLTAEMIDYMIDTISGVVRKHSVFALV